MLTVTVTFSALWGAPNPTATHVWTGNGKQADGTTPDYSWTNPDNWSGSGYPSTSAHIVEITGESAASIILNENNLSVGDIILNSKGSNEITINLNGNIITTTRILLVQESGNINIHSNVKLTGSGIFKCTTFDFSDSAGNTFSIDENTTLKITDTLWANSSGGLSFSGTGYLYMPKGGGNVNYGPTNINYSGMDSTHRLPNDEPGAKKTYDVDYTKNGFPIEITIKNEGSKGTQPVNFPFSIVTKGSHTYTLTPDGGTGSNIPPLDGVSSGTNFININGANSTKKYTLNSSDTFAKGEGITIIIRSPDNFMEIGRVTWYKDTPIWVGGSDGNNWTTVSNWTNLNGKNPDDFSTEDIEISADINNCPVINSNVKVNSITLAGESVLHHKSGTLTTNKIETTITSHFYGTESGSTGTVILTGAAQLVEDNSPNISLYNLELEDNASFSQTRDFNFHSLKIGTSSTYKTNTKSLSLYGDFYDSGNFTGTINIIENEGSNNTAQLFSKSSTSTTASYALNVNKNGGYILTDGDLSFSAFSKTNSSWDLIIKNNISGAITAKLPDNLAIAADPTINVNLTSELNTKNIIIYSGKINFTENISASHDLIILGQNYVSTRPFDYECFIKRPVGWISPNVTSFIAKGTELADKNNLEYKSIITIADGKKISAGKNLYINGTTISSTTNFFIEIPQNDNASAFCGEVIKSAIENCTVSCASDGSSDGSKSQLPATGCTLTNCFNFDDSEFKISEAKTVWDNRIFVTLNREPRNSNNEISSALTNIKTSSGCFTAAYSQAGGNTGTTAYTSGTSLYLYTDGTTANSSKLWNTDATGKSAGYSDSTDSHNKHCTTTPYVKIPQFIVSAADGSITSGYVITDKWGKRLKDYSAAPFDDVLDSTPPVLAAVYTGQEKHESSATNQAPYDAHNFVEFRYSEPVNIGTKFPLSASAKVDNENIQTSVQTLPGGGTSFGGLESDGLTLSEIGKFSSLLLNCGRNNNPDNATTHALYRWFSTTATGTSEYQKCRIRLSIAGYVNSTITHNGINYNNWDSYIDSAQTPAGTFIPKISSVAPIAQITDTAKDISGTDAPNQLAENLTYSGGAIPVTQPAALNGFDTLYSNWDTSAPSFVPNRNDEGTDSWSFSNGDNCEIVGTNSSAGGTTINSIEFHLFDNTPVYNTTEPAWFSEIGWVSNASSTKSKTSLMSDANNHFASADLTGGARAFESNTSRRTTGGIRYSTLYATAQTDAFKYSLSGIPSDSFISGNFSTSVSSPLFSGTTEPKNSPAITDSPYFSLGITDAGIPLKTTFNISYNASAGFITDLAGNKMKTYNVKSIDRTAPAYSFVLSPLGSNQLNIVFAKKIVINSSDLKLINNLGYTVSVTENFSTIIPECFELIKIPDSGGTGTRADASTGELQINSSQPAIVRYYPANPNLTIVTLELNRAVTLEDLAKKNGDSKYYLRLIQASSYSGTNYKDPVTNLIGCTTTFIMDEQGNFMTCNEAHAISDFIVSPVSPLYAHISDITSEDGTDFLKNVYSQTSEAARNFNRNQQNYGSILHGYEFTIVSSLSDGTPGNTQLSNTANTMNKIGLKMYISDVPDSASVSKTFNYDYKKDLRVWFPVLAWSTPFKAFSNINNTRFWNFDSTLLEQDKPQNGFSFVIPAQTAELFKKNCQATFLFSLFNTEDNEDYKVCSSPILTGTDTYNVSTQNPLFALRLTDPSDFTSLDLWSIRLRSITEQRGGVSILNNVINPTNGEKAVVKVNMPQTDNLNVIIMTLDGNIVRYLQHGTASAGEHFYYWDGTNENGSKCARGMYFVIVKGPDIDENRKIMVVK